MIVIASILLLGSGLLWWFHVDYQEIYDYLKDDYKELSKEEIVTTLCRNDFKIIIFASFIFWMIHPLLLLVSIGALMTFITVKIPSLERALISE